LLYGQLIATHPEYDLRTWSTIRDLYVGGFSLAARARQYLPKLVNETDERYKERLSSAVYSNHFSTILDNGVAELFREKLSMASPAEVDEFWSTFAADTDLRGNDLSSVLKDVLLDALLCGRTYLGIDFPRVEGASSLAEENALGGARAYAFPIKADGVTDWEHASVSKIDLGPGKSSFTIGRFSWCVQRAVRFDRPSPGAPAWPAEEFTVWQMSHDGFATWQRYRTAPQDPNGDVLDNDCVIPKVGEGVTSFRSIPVVELRLSSGMWLGSKLGPLALDMFQRSSALKASVQRSMFALPVVKLGPEIGAVAGAQPSEVQQNPGRAMSPSDAFSRHGYMVLGAEDDVKYLEPSAAPFELADRMLKDLVDDMYRVANQTGRTLAATSKGVGRSGISKLTDKEATNVWLGALGEIVKGFALKVYSLISLARGEDLVWSASGLDDYDTDDRETLMGELVAAASVDIGSPTFAAEWKTRLAMAVAGSVSDESRAAIKTEIKEHEIRRQTGPIASQRTRASSGGGSQFRPDLGSRKSVPSD
jgi:hypothetical protein